jgi:hypothetical protein
VNEKHASAKPAGGWTDFGYRLHLDHQFAPQKAMESQTLRRKIRSLLNQQEMDARELSQALGIKEKEVYEHLVHVERSVASSGGKFIVTPSLCQLCGYVFEARRRLTRPGRCPACRRSKLQNPSFRIA